MTVARFTANDVTSMLEAGLSVKINLTRTRTRAGWMYTVEIDGTTKRGEGRDPHAAADALLAFLGLSPLVL